MYLTGQFTRNLMFLLSVALFAGNGGGHWSSTLLMSCCSNSGSLQSATPLCPADVAWTSVCVRPNES